MFTVFRALSEESAGHVAYVCSHAASRVARAGYRGNTSLMV